MANCSDMTLNTAIFRADARPSLALRAFDALLGWQRRARQRGQLAGMSDSDLKDVGLSRSDVAAEADKPFWRG
ncbi:DUF1127 domain-containing protein [Ferrovibrio xuzhouensis]|uniref:DUF1127 domain-containing protein n=1 Tax=Ferrovibrio xuzhouensis TaxID=1576914 RepID=A0ABV7VDU4_9PROT